MHGAPTERVQPRGTRLCTLDAYRPPHEREHDEPHLRPPPCTALEHAQDLKTAFPDVDKAARALMYTLASALASNFDEARRLGCTDLLLVTTNVVTRPTGSG